MPDYKLGKIYRLSNGHLVYIGSTAQLQLSMRLGDHKSHYKRWVKTGKYYTSSFELFKVGTPTIELIESYPCNSKDELRAREGHHQKLNVCVNKYMAGQTASEYYIANKDKLNEQSKLYYAANKDKLSERNKLYRAANQTKISEQKKLYRAANKDKLNKREKIYRATNQAKKSDYQKQYRAANKEKRCEYARMQYAHNKRIERLTLFIQNHIRICSE